MKELLLHFKRISFIYYPIYYIFLIILLICFLFTASGNCQSPLPFYSPFSYNLAAPGYPFMQTYPSSVIATQKVQIYKEFLPGTLSPEAISFLLQSEKSISILISIVCKNGVLLFLEALPEEGIQEYSIQGNRIFIFAGSEKTNGEWHSWEINSIRELCALTGQEYNCITRVAIQGEHFCLGSIAVISDGENGETDTAYIASFTDKREAFQDYGWTSSSPLTYEYHDAQEDSSGEIGEGYVCLSNVIVQQQKQFPSLPLTFLSPPQWGKGPILPVTLYTKAPLYPPSFSITPPPQLFYTLFSQAYSTPINPILGLGILQSIPLYINAQTGDPYSVRNNILQAGDSLPQYPTQIDYSTDPLYAYLTIL